MILSRYYRYSFGKRYLYFCRRKKVDRLLVIDAVLENGEQFFDFRDFNDESNNISSNELDGHIEITIPKDHKCRLTIKTCKSSGKYVVSIKNML